MNTVKLRPKLAEQLERANASDLLEIILELQPQTESDAMAQSQSRSEKIVAQKEAFSRSVLPVEEAIRNLGGEITGRAWINHTVRARVPAQGVKELSEHEKVAALDTPNPIKPDFG